MHKQRRAPQLKKQINTPKIATHSHNTTQHRDARPDVTQRRVDKFLNAQLTKSTIDIEMFRIVSVSKLPRRF